jgi:hypothetical protein
MDDAQLPEIFRKILTELNEVSDIAESLKSIDVETMQVSDKADFLTMINTLTKGVSITKQLIEIYSNDINRNPEFQGFRHDTLGHVTTVWGIADLFSKFAWDNAEFSQIVEDLERHSEFLRAMVYSMK